MTKETPRRRARLDTAERINTEIARIYRKLADGKMTPAAAARQVATLVALRSGMPEVAERKNEYTPPAINVFSVPSSCFLSFEQIQAVKKGEPIIDVAQCTPMTFEPAAPTVDDNNIVPLRLATEAQSSEQILGELRDMAGRMDAEAEGVETLTSEEEQMLVELRDMADRIGAEMLSPEAAKRHAELCGIADKLLIKYGLDPTDVG